MMKFRILFLRFFLLVVFGCNTGKHALIFENEIFRIEEINHNTFQHITYLQTDDFGRVACNGMIYRSGKEAIVFDTPSNNEDAKVLIDWIEGNL